MHLVVLPVTSNCNPSTTGQACMHSSNSKCSSSRSGVADDKSLASMTGTGAKKSPSTQKKKKKGRKNPLPRAKNELDDEARARGKLGNAEIRVRCLRKKRVSYSRAHQLGQLVHQPHVYLTSKDLFKGPLRPFPPLWEFVCVCVCVCFN